MVALFDFIKILFSKGPEWDKLSDQDKSRNFFMVNRYMSIKFPVQAAHLSHMRINTVEVLNYWHRNLIKTHSNVPGWVYAKTKKKESAEKASSYSPSEDMISWYCQRNEISRKDFDRTIKLFGSTFLDELKSMEKILKSQGVI